MVSRFEVLTSAGAGIGCLASAVAILMRDERPQVFTRFARLLVAVGVALVLRAWKFGTLNPVPWHGLLVATSLIPLLATLYAEGLLRRHAHLPMKIVLLAGTAAFAVTSFTPLIYVEWWAFAFFAYLVGTVVYLAVLALLAASNRAQPASSSSSSRGHAERSLFLAHALGGAVCAALIVTDWLPTFDVATPKLGGVGVVFLVYVVGAALAGGGSFRLRTLFLRFLVALVACAILAALVAVSHDVDAFVRGDLSVAAVAFLVLMFAYLAADPLRATFAELAARPGEVLIERLAELPNKNLDEYLNALRAWPEVKAVVVLTTQSLREQGFDKAQAWFAADPRPATRESVAAAARVADGGVVLAAEQVQTLLDAHAANNAAALWQGGPILVVTFMHTVDAAWVRPILAHVTPVAALLAQRDGLA